MAKWRESAVGEKQRDRWRKSWIEEEGWVQGKKIVFWFLIKLWSIKRSNLFQEKGVERNNDQSVYQPSVISGEKSNTGSSQTPKQDIRSSPSQALEHDIKSSQAPEWDILSSQSQDPEWDIESSQAPELDIGSSQVFERPRKVPGVKKKKRRSLMLLFYSVIWDFKNLFGITFKSTGRSPSSLH